MLKRNALFSAIVAASSVANISHAQIEEVIVTATKRAASTQDIPVAVSALNQESLENMGVSNFSDYLIQLPGVTAGGSGPGQNTIYIRGVASSTPNLTTAGVAGLAPNVALYLDEQPLAQPGRNLDVYAADLARIEVLSGPQGTLFGASSQAGTVRLITNKPDPSGMSGNIKLGLSNTSGGDGSHNLEGVINIPVNDSLAVRAVAYVDKQGGYIDNVAGTIDASDSARFRPAGTIRDNGLAVSSGRGGFQSGADLSGVNFLASDNAALVEKDFNEATYTGGRISALYEFNENWTLHMGVSQQTLDSEGVFFVDPDLDDLEIQRYEEDTLEDSFENVNWTLEGRLGSLDVVYTGAFTEREADQFVDYTDYLFVGQYLPYYICDGAVTYPGAGGPSGTCQAPNLFVKSRTETDVETHELRFVTSEDEAIRATFGGFYSSLEIRELNNFTYPGSTQAISFDGVTRGFGPNFSAQGSSVSDAGQWPAGVIFRNDILRTDEQVAVFGEATVDLSDEFALTLGARWYDVEVDLKGSAAGSFGNFGASSDNNAGNNLDTLFSGENDTAATDGWIGKISLAWTPSGTQLYYATLSEGFRPGLLNRPGGKGNDTYTVPFGIDTDDVTNYEFGWKTDLLDGSLRLNGSVFFIEIERLQTGILDPSIANLFFVSNAADAEVTGVDANFTWAPYNTIEGLTVSGALSLLDTEITEVIIPTDDVVKGDELAFAPSVQANIQARYEWSLSSGLMAHVMPHIAYSDSAYTDIITINRSEIDSWLMVGLTAGVSSEEWSAELYLDNITDERAEVSGSFTFDRERINVSRPRTAGLRLSYNF